MGFALSLFSLEIGGVVPRVKIMSIRMVVKEKAIIRISQNINGSMPRCRHTFRYAYHVTTYLPFRRERRAICTCSRAPFRKITFFNLLLSPVL